MYSRLFIFIILPSLVVVSLSGCFVRYSIDARNQTFNEVIRRSADLQTETLQTRYFKHRIVYRITRPGEKHLVVYIEGDGFAWDGKYQASDDPTPLDPVAARMMQQDGRANVLYIARPCQYTRASDDRCEEKYWTSHRYSKQVIASIDEAIELFINRQGLDVNAMTLIGYSGGGTLAMLLATQTTRPVRPIRPISMVITVASNLDHRAWSRYHQVTPLQGSEELTGRAERLRAIPQLHLSGSEDRIVPANLTEQFISDMGLAGIARLRVMKGFDHKCCWADEWQDILRNNYQGLN
ncbi:MAG: hypothetical protein BMS9Abin26_1735 [Gammaproteobacteria bacterium]|nr:MAG: hypothetical protein BMS9Abin26_1735 [Gammaproteobacteria bacterium]